MTLVMKFGGTSVGSAAAFKRTVSLVQQSVRQGEKVVVVVSAMGSKPEKVTDLLLQGARSALGGDGESSRSVADQLRRVHYEAIDGLLAPEQERQQILAQINRFIDRFEALCRAVLVLGELTPSRLRRHQRDGRADECKNSGGCFV